MKHLWRIISLEIGLCVEESMQYYYNSTNPKEVRKGGGGKSKIKNTGRKQKEQNIQRQYANTQPY